MVTTCSSVYDDWKEEEAFAPAYDSHNVDLVVMCVRDRSNKNNRFYIK